MLTELGGKGGCLCEPARRGELRCPLIVRANSEDVVTANIFGTLKVLNPRWWLPDLLNSALGANRFRRQVYRRLRIELWQKQRAYPRQYLPWVEGNTEVDVVITWENPPTTIFIEMKYGSGLGPTTVNNDGTTGYPSDQLIRNARVGLRENGWFDGDYLFDIPPRDFALVLLAPDIGNPFVRKYRDPSTLRSSIPRSENLTDLPRLPFIGELGYRGLICALEGNRRWLSRSERQLVEQLTDYLQLKLTYIRKMNRTNL
jgi:hypothetical protein